MCVGYVYLAQLYPDRDKRLIKIGFSKDPAKRLQKHRTIAPNSMLLATYAVTNKNKEHLCRKALADSFDCLYGGEVVVCEPDLVQNFCDVFFERIKSNAPKEL